MGTPVLSDSLSLQDLPCALMLSFKAIFFSIELNVFLLVIEKKLECISWRTLLEQYSITYRSKGYHQKNTYLQYNYDAHLSRNIARID